MTAYEKMAGTRGEVKTAKCFTSGGGGQKQSAGVARTCCFKLLRASSSVAGPTSPPMHEMQPEGVRNSSSTSAMAAERPYALTMSTFRCIVGCALKSGIQASNARRVGAALLQRDSMPPSVVPICRAASAATSEISGSSSVMTRTRSLSFRACSGGGRGVRRVGSGGCDVTHAGDSCSALPTS